LDGFFALIFLFATPNHFTKQTMSRLPLASIAVPLSGVVAIAGLELTSENAQVGPQFGPKSGFRLPIVGC
jgi:hypothetical protein